MLEFSKHDATMPVHEQPTEMNGVRHREESHIASAPEAEQADCQPGSGEPSAAGFGGSVATWLKRVGLVGFLFFFIKGLVWLGIFFWAGTCAFQG